MLKTQRATFGLIAVVAALAVIACGGATSSGGETTTAPETNSGEAGTVTYVDSRYHYRIDAPGHITPAADGSAGFVGPTERIQIAVVQTTGADLAVAARADIVSLPTSLTAFHLKSGPTAIAINGKPAEKFVYTYSAGVSTVTGKPLSLVGVRYYIPKDASTMAVVSYGIAADQYDPQGADDVASTFRWQ